MKCHLCGTENSPEAVECSFCDTIFAENTEAANSRVTIDAVDTSSTRLSWKKTVIALAICMTIVIPWYFMTDLLSVPKDVQENQKNFEKTLNNYLQQQKLWKQKKDTALQNNNLLHGDIPLEAFFAYLEEDLGFNLTNVTIFPNSNSSIMITKRQRGLWPLSVVLSLEMGINIEKGQISVHFIRLRRGQREVSPGLAWAYFGPELGRLRRLEFFAEGTRNLQISEHTLQIFWQQTTPSLR